ncbi:MAG TPA: hypothetical protein PKZ32_00790 [Candidatus Melainabacteria bacterium]|nr:hypothetical protein [Candidatus Melainabacteria bacterium]
MPALDSGKGGKFLLPLFSNCSGFCGTRNALFSIRKNTKGNIMQSKFILVAVLVCANGFGFSFVKLEELSRFDFGIFDSGAKALLAMAVMFVTVASRKLAMHYFKIPEQGLWLPAFIHICETLLCGVAIMLAASFAPTYFPYTSVFVELFFWFHIGSIVVILYVLCGDLPWGARAAD